LAEQRREVLALVAALDHALARSFDGDGYVWSRQLIVVRWPLRRRGGRRDFISRSPKPICGTSRGQEGSGPPMIEGTGEGDSMKRGSHAFGAALLATILVIGVGSVEGGPLVTGATVKNNSLTGKDIRNDR
jgi:hypothetical protein